jgi:selenium metabolism protein YedF
MREGNGAMIETIDARGKPCPQPVVMTKRVLDSVQEGILTVIVDNPTSRDNVERFARSQGCDVEVEERKEGYFLSIIKGYPCEVEVGALTEEKAEASSEPHVVVYVSSDQMGMGDQELGSILIRAFLKTLKDVNPKPKKLIFVNSGVKLTTEGSDAIESIKELEAMSMVVLSCGTCLDYYRLKDKLQVGIVSNMFDIASSLMEADRVIKP